MTLEERVARLEGRIEGMGQPATKADMLELSRQIANLATGVGTDLRALRQDVAEIRRLLERRRRWPF